MKNEPNFEGYRRTAEALRQRAEAIQNAIAVLAAINDNEDVEPTAPLVIAPVIAATVAPVASAAPVAVPTKGTRITDAHIVAVLNHKPADAHMIADALAGRGLTIMRPNLYGKLKRLAETRADVIEEMVEKVKCWRLATGDAAPIAPKSAPSTKTPSKALAAPKARGPVSATNDNIIGQVVLPPLADGLHQGDCIEVMRAIPDQSIDLILCDPPFGTCGAKTEDGEPIDIPLDLDALWTEYRRIIKPRGNIVLFGSQPFTTDLINAARDLFKYSIIWRKDTATGYNHARNKPLKDFEDILVFSPANVGHADDGMGKSGRTKNRATYNPWRAREVEKVNNPMRNARARFAPNMKAYPGRHKYLGLENCPRMVLEYGKEDNTVHPYQKPQGLLNDLIRMYSNAGEIVLDNCLGGGSTAIAAINADRRWIGIEKTKHYFEVSAKRIAEHKAV